MGDVHRGGAQGSLEFNDARACAVAELGVEVAERFIHQEHRRFSRHGASQGDALFLAAGQFLRQPIQERLQLKSLGHCLDLLSDLLFSARTDPECWWQASRGTTELVLQLLPW